MMSKRCAVFISGRGSNLSVLLAGQPHIEVSLVLSNREKAPGLARAKEAHVPTEILSSPIDWEKVQKSLVDHQVAAIFLAGFMKIIPKEFIDLWQGRIFNVHPSLLPKYKGLNGLKRAFDDGADIGASVHRVTPEVDGGEVLFQEVSIPSGELPGMTLAEVESINLKLEHQLVRKWIEAWPKHLMSSY